MSDPVDTNDELQRLKQEVRAAISERLDLDQQLANLAALRSATARAYRDRDAVTSPVLEEARSKIAAELTAFHDEWRQVDRIAWSVLRLDEFLKEAPAHIREHRDAIAAQMPAARQARARIAETMKNADLASILPDQGLTDGER